MTKKLMKIFALVMACMMAVTAVIMQLVITAAHRERKRQEAN